MPDRKAVVKCTFEIEVTIPGNVTNPFFYIEENGCPTTGAVGAALQEVIAAHEERSTCWSCALQGENEILSIDGIPAAQLRHTLS